jgi:hypothetical protein
MALGPFRDGDGRAIYATVDYATWQTEKDEG